MFGRIAKVVAYVKAPRKTFVMLHPIKALKFGAAFYVGKLLLGSRGNRERTDGQARVARVTTTHTRIRTADGAGRTEGPRPGATSRSHAADVLDGSRMQPRGGAV